MNTQNDPLGHLEMVNETQGDAERGTGNGEEESAHEIRETHEGTRTGLTAESAESTEKVRSEAPLSSFPDKRREEIRRGRSDLGVEAVEAWEEAVEGAALLNELRSAVSRHVVSPPHAAETLALWILHTYAFELRNVTSYIGVVSPEKRCGKTTLLTLLAKLANRPIVAANISPSALFRVIEELRPTLLIDESDTFLQANEEMRGILNSGYSQDGAYVMRVAETRQVERPSAERGTVEREPLRTRLARFSCWCPKVMAAIGSLPDTLADRCIVITMQRKRFGEACERLRSLATEPLRQKCVRFVKDHAEEIRQWKPQIPPTLNDRAADIWEPLFVLAELAGSEWPNLAREAAVKLSGEAQESSATATLFFDIFVTLMSEDRERIFSRDLVRSLSGLKERPWAEMRKEKPLTEMALAGLLRPYGIRSRTIWIGEESAKGYLTEDFTEAVSRYSLPLVQPLLAERKGNLKLTTEGTEGTEP